MVYSKLDKGVGPCPQAEAKRGPLFIVAEQTIFSGGGITFTHPFLQTKKTLRVTEKESGIASQAHRLRHIQGADASVRLLQAVVGTGGGERRRGSGWPRQARRATPLASGHNWAWPRGEVEFDGVLGQIGGCRQPSIHVHVLEVLENRQGSKIA